MGRDHGGCEKQSYCRHILKGELIGSPDRVDVEGNRKRREVNPRILVRASENGIACWRGGLRETRVGRDDQVILPPTQFSHVSTLAPSFQGLIFHL